MAEAILRQLSRGRATVASAGLKPKSEVDPLAQEAVRNVLNATIVHARPKAIEAIAADQFDVVFTLSNSVADCSTVATDAERIHWNLADPAIAQGTRDQRRVAFEKVARELLKRLRPWWRTHENAHREAWARKLPPLPRSQEPWRTFPEADTPIVLVIDYGPVRRSKNMCTLFQRSGFRVVRQNTHGHAADTLGFRPDVVLVRVDGPPMESKSRPEFKRLSRLRARLGDAPIIVVADHAPSDQERRLLTKSTAELVSRRVATSGQLVKVLEDRISPLRS